MSYVTNVLPAIITVLESVDVGKLHNRPRNSEFVEDHKVLFVDASGGFRGAFVDRVAAPAEGALANQIFRNHSIVIDFYHAVNDELESSNLLQATIDAVLMKFDAVIDLAANIHQLGVPQMLEKFEEMFGGVLCHRGKIQIIIQEEVTP